MPRGADSVVMQEDTRVSDGAHGSVDVLDAVKPWENVRFAGEDVKAGAPVLREGERISAGLARLPVQQWRSGANFILFRPSAMAGRAVWQGLLDRSVLIRDCSGWPRLTDCLRVTVGTREENDAFLNALQEVLSA